MFDEPDDATKTSLVTSLFADTNADLLSYEAYFAYYQETVNTIARHFSNQQQSRHLYPTTHSDIKSLVDIIRNSNANCTRPSLRQTLKSQGYRDVPENTLNHYVELIVRLMLMVNVGRGMGTAFTGNLRWNDEETLSSLIKHHVGNVDSGIIPDKTFSMRFTAATMIKHCRLKVVWTDSIHEHLELSKRRSKNVLRVFRHKSWLRCRSDKLKSSPRAVNHACPLAEALSNELLEETLATINLLFPSDDSDTNDICDKKGWSIHAEYPAGRLTSGERSLPKYRYWHTRLLSLYEEVYEARPSWRNLWFDHRDPERWMTIWIGGFLLLVLTLISTIASVVQTVYSVKAFNAGSIG